MEGHSQTMGPPEQQRYRIVVKYIYRKKRRTERCYNQRSPEIDMRPVLYFSRLAIWEDEHAKKTIKIEKQECHTF